MVNNAVVTKRNFSNTGNIGMSDEELLWRVEVLRKLEMQREELDAQIETLKDEVKAEMRTRGVEKIAVGTHRISWCSM